MALKVKAVERLLKFDKEKEGKYRYVLKPDLYTSLTQAKVIKEAALRSGVSRGHSVALPGLGTMRFGLRSKAVEKVEDVKTGLIESRRIIFTPDVDLKDELKNTAIQITCIDRNGKEVKRVTSTDPGTIEDNENPSTGSGTEENGSGSENGGENGSGTEVHSGSGIIPTPTDPEDDQPSD